MGRMVAMYGTTLVVLALLDGLWLGVVTREFFKARLGDMLGELRLLPAVLFYLAYPIGVMIFASAQAADWRSAALFGALFGLFVYGTYDLTNLAILRHWDWTVAAVDIAWGAVVTGLAATAGHAVAQLVAR